MVEIDSNVLIFLSIAFVGAISTLSLIKSLKGKNKMQQEAPKGVKRTSQEGQENFVEVLKDSAAEALAFKEQQIESLKKEIKSLTGQVTKLKGLMYGTADPNEIAALEHDGRQAGKIQKSGNIPDEVINMRLRLMADKLKIPPMLMHFDVIGDALRDIASDPRFDEIAAAALSNQNQSATVQTSSNDL